MILAMNIGWQDAVTLGLVAAAVIYLIRRLRRLGRQRAGCGTCEDCEQPSKGSQLILIEPPKEDP
jgi:hypothetical protein